MTLYEVRCCKQCDAINAYGRLLGICEEDAVRRWVVYGHARRWANENVYKGEENDRTS